MSAIPITNEAAALLRERDQLAEAFDALGEDCRRLRAERDGLRREAALWAERDREQRTRNSVLRNRVEQLREALESVANIADSLMPMRDRVCAIRDRCADVLGLPEVP